MKECTVAGCDKTQQYLKRRMCNNCYERWRRNGDPTVDGRRIRRKNEPEATEKQCRKCGEVKPIEQFYRRLTPTLWYYTKCKDCVRVARKAKALQDRLDNPPVPKPKVTHGKCDFEGCTSPARARLLNLGGPEGWYCTPHFTQWSKHRTLTPKRPSRKSYISDEFRRCTACEKVKTHDDFHDRTGGGKQGQCRECYYLIARTNYLVRHGRAQEALRLAESMPDNIREKYMGKVLAAINEAGRGEESP